MSHENNTIIYEARGEWLEEHQVAEKDVLSDERGEYILLDADNGNPEEDGYDVSQGKLYLPLNLSLE